MTSRFRNLALFSPLDALRLALRVPRCAQAVIRDSFFDFKGCPFPRRIGLFLTDRCNFACPMCAVIDVRNEGLRRGGDLPFELVEKVYRESAPYGPAIDLIGGEPLLYRHISDVLRLAARTRVLSVLTTNGMLLRDYVDSIVESRLPILQISLDGWDEESQRLRGNVKHSFERIAQGLAELRRARGNRVFPIVRILTAITRNNHAHLDRIQEAVHSFGVKYWGVANYFFVTQSAMRAHRVFALQHGLTGLVAADAIEGDVYLAPEQVRNLKDSLQRVREQNRSLGVRINYNWGVDLDNYYSERMPSRQSGCDLPYSRLDIHTDGGISVCVSGKTIGHVGKDSLTEVWRGRQLAAYRRMYEASKPMPMCFRCCGLSWSDKL